MLIESPDLRQLLGEILSGLEPEYREYQRYGSTLDAPPLSPDFVGYALDSDDTVVVTRVDWELARAEPAFRQRVLQGISVYSSLLRAHRYRIAIDEGVLDILSDSGFQPSGNWLEETQKRLTD